MLFPFPRGAGNGTRAASGASNHAASGAVRACGSGNLRTWRHGVFSHGYTAPLSRAAPIFPTKACTSPQRLIGRQLISASFGFALAPAASLQNAFEFRHSKAFCSDETALSKISIACFLLKASRTFDFLREADPVNQPMPVRSICSGDIKSRSHQSILVGSIPLRKYKRVLETIR